MIDSLITLDVTIFRLINGRLHTPFLDVAMRLVTTQENWYVVLLIAWVALIIWGGHRGRMAAAMLVVAVALSDQITCSLLKPLVARLRPCNALDAETVRLIVGGSKAFSFPSAHASNSFAMAAVASWRFENASVLFYGFAALVAYSRVYAGLHYPSDVVAGAILGFVVGWFSTWLVSSITRRLTRHRDPLSA